MLPKYTEIMAILQDRIDRKVYQVGALLPSEAEFTAEFGTSRATVVRALRTLGRQGWLRGVQGKGRLVLGRPVMNLLGLPCRVQYLLQADRHAMRLSIRRIAATPRIAAALTISPGVPVTAARYLLTLPNATPFGLTTAFTPIQLPAVPPGVGLLNRLEEHTGRSAFRVTERLGARLATDTETKALQLSHPRSVAVSLLTVLDTLETPYFVVDAVLSREARPVVEVYEI
ncbi:GntR family transcriptional regulator [Dactylosporangium sp. CA-233914]|uniref:GntR family transcriptional regulator n=1 Tax=Dactylosporangium sp. CA-233914 TaxID=3239934 RepID=UPI003D8AB65C